MTIPPHDHRHDHGSGFALVATLALMTLLVVISIGLLSLSAVSLRGGSAEAAKAEARANARLALVMAIAQLQKHAGIDTRITAPADFLSPADPEALAHPGWRGVWRSNASTPKNYQAARSDFFDGWLVTTLGKPHDLDVARSGFQGESRVLLEEADGPGVDAPVINIPDGGRLGWWTDDESLKALANLPREEPDSKGAAAAASHAAPRPAPEALPELSGFDPSAGSTAGMLTPGQLELAVERWPDPQGRHFTTWSKSVLADVRNGGLKQDLSALFEQAPERITEFGKWTGSGSESDRRAYLYGPAAVAMGARWNHLYAYYRLYKDVSFSGSEPRVEPKEDLIDWHLADQLVDFGDEAGGFRYPRMTKIIYVFSYTAVKDPSTANPRPYSLHLGTDVFVTLWNPFDARIHFPVNSKFFAKFSFVLPMQFEWQLGTQAKVTASPGDINGTGWFQRSFNLPGGGRQFSMGPGETVVFSLKEDPSTGSTEFWPGAFYDGMNNKVVQVANGTGSEKVSAALKPAQPSNAGGGDSVPNSQYIDFWIRDVVKGWPYYEHRGEILSRADAPFIKQMRAVSAAEVPSVTLADVVGRKQPFGAFIMEIKTARDSTVPIPAFLNSGTTRLSSKLSASLAEFANERLEYKVEPVTGFDSDIIQVTLPHHPAGPDHGFIGSGRGPGTGQTHFLFSSIPTVPPTSLAQFRHAGVGDGASTLRATHWGLNSTPNAPFADQSIGNSYAHPLVPPNAASKGSLLDHRYLGNEVLWDKYFLSSLAPRGEAMFGTASTMNETWEGFLEGGSRLINTRFRPWLGGESPETLTRRIFASGQDSSMRNDAYKRIASHLLYDGGFNINSTSVEAWRAFLSSSRLRSITRLPKAGGTSGEEITGSGTVFSRTETVLEGAVDEAGSDEASHYAGFRDLSGEQVGRLAEEVVAQVRERGPFLNLSEFINRRLTNETDLALSGALQSAIDRSGLNDAAASGGTTGSASPGGASMAFPKASSLNTAAGNPGWLMQADILDPLGPSIVARGDTFRIRGYGESLGADGKVLARAWCESVVQRVPDYIDRSEASHLTVAKKPLNLRWGRRFDVVSFRWLAGPRD